MILKGMIGVYEGKLFKGKLFTQEINSLNTKMACILDTLHVPLSLEISYPPLIKSSAIDFFAVRESLREKLSEQPATVILNEFCQRCNQKAPLYRSYNVDGGFIKCAVSMNGRKFECLSSHVYETEAKNDAASCALYDIFNNPGRVYVEISEQFQMRTYVSCLNELCQQSGYALPEYFIEKSIHDGRFKAKVTIAGITSFRGEKYPKKQQAKEDAAREAYEDLCGRDTSSRF